MNERLEGVAFPPTATEVTAEGQMLRTELVREMVARRERGESTRQIARELAVDRKTVRRWLRLGGWQPRQRGARPRALDAYLPFIERRGPEVSWNGVVLYRELVGLGFCPPQKLPAWPWNALNCDQFEGRRSEPRGIGP